MQWITSTSPSVEITIRHSQSQIYLELVHAFPHQFAGRAQLFHSQGQDQVSDLNVNAPAEGAE